MKKIKNGDSVKVNYTGKLENGTIFDSSMVEGREPLSVVIGEKKLIKGFESALIDMSIGEKKTIEIEPSEGYGEINEMLVSEVPKTNVPEGVKEGEMLQGMTQLGPVSVRVVEVKEESVILDANHPLAGKKLVFDLEVVSID